MNGRISYGTPTENSGDGHLTDCISTAAFATPLYAYGNAGRDILFGPGLYNIDFSLFKHDNREIQFALKLLF